ncbi:MAG: four helix bundle protein [Mesorhizobium sp.]|nr:MAG: four helix bundle protein [Mesorhizobium sp.]RWM63535.1 MAG: four helix bundle protein [Mesorhizobium sp.]TIO21895.1 MAG: four helix bundle protein [Mesorhizobium sp.]TJV55635.1 MAG: four helix bundle protein [Mesorhizobium sp.]
MAEKTGSYKDLIVWQQAMDREVRGSYQQFLRIAQGSLKELETQLLIAERTGIAPNATAAPLLASTESVGKLLRLLIRKLSAD